MSRPMCKNAVAFFAERYYNDIIENTIGSGAGAALSRIQAPRPPRGRNGMKLPSDGAVLLSFVNTKLRDRYDSLDALCEDYEADRGELEEKLRALGYEYDPARNAFR